MSTSVRNAFPDAEFVEFSHGRTARGTLISKARAIVKLWSPYPAKIRYGRCVSVVDRLRDLQDDGRRTLVVLDGSESLSFLGEVPSFCETAHLSHNVDWVLYKDRIDRMGPVARAVAAMGLEVPKYRNLELRGVEKIDHLLCISPSDLQEFASQTGRLHRSAVAIPPVFHYNPSRTQPVPERGNVSFLADYRWPPNSDGISRFIERCWNPSLGWRLNLYGIGSERFEDRSRGVHSIGFVDDVRDIWDSTDVMIAPIYSGGGINIKTCEALFNRVPIVATEFALRGLPDHIRSQACVVASDREWMDGIARAAIPDAVASDYFSGQRAVAAVRGLFEPNSLFGREAA